MSLLTCLPAFAQETYYEELGLSLDFDAIAGQSANFPVLANFGIATYTPYTVTFNVLYYDLPENAVTEIKDYINNTDDRESAELLEETLDSLTATIAAIIVTNAKTLAEAGLDEPMPDGYTMTELGTLGDYHYYYITAPADELLARYDTDEDLSAYGTTPEAEKEKTRADIEMIQSELLRQLQAAGLSEPANPAAGIVGQVIQFETTDLDGKPVSSADLFRDNRITMVNLWGTWCKNCMNELGELAKLHTRLQEKGCGIVGVEKERGPVEEVADMARQVFAENGAAYPNVLFPEDNPIFSQVRSWPTTFFVDSEGRILTYPIRGAAVEDYEPTIDKLLAGEAIEAAPETGATANDTGTYRVIVYDKAGNPVQGAIIELCDDTSCDFRETDAEGVATFTDKPQKVYDIHMIMAPEGYVQDEGAYKTLDAFSDVNIFIGKAA